jgi:hypothetical protein
MGDLKVPSWAEHSYIMKVVLIWYGGYVVQTGCVYFFLYF